MSWLLQQFNRLPAPWNWIAKLIAAVVLISLLAYLFSQVQSCGYQKARKEYEKVDAEKKAEADKLLNENQQLRGQIAELETQKQAFKTLGEQGIKLDQEKAKQIDEISANSAQELDLARADMDCRTRAERTVALLRTAKPPIVLDLAEVVRKQCPAR